MAIVEYDLGAIMPVYKDDWVTGVTYERHNVVRDANACWICKVASTTSRPSTTNPDWMQMAVDSSNVASVNGQTGTVIVTKIPQGNVPAESSNSNDIATTEWVRTLLNAKVGNVSDNQYTIDLGSL